MKTRTAFYKTFEGSSYEVGKQLGIWVLSQKNFLNHLVLPPGSYQKKNIENIIPVFDKYCSGINDEIRGFTEVVNIGLKQVLLYISSYLETGCNLMAALPAKTGNGHTIMARTFDFSDDMEDMCFTKMKIEGKYTHISSMCNFFGRADGMNEHGLAACCSSNGMPVGHLEGMRKPGVTGLDFTIIIRSILENCSEVKEAIDFMMRAPIASNLNIMVADKKNTIALFECIDGHKAYKILDDQNEKTFLSAANHTVFPELKQYEEGVIKNSVIRNDLIVQVFESREKISCDDIKQLLSTSYPQGLCCHYYKDFFGSLRPMIFDVTEGTVEMTYGSPQYNKWHKFKLDDRFDSEETVNLPYEKAPDDFLEMVYINY